MNRSRSMAAFAAAVALLAGGAHGALAQGDSPVTLRFAVADGEGAPSDPYVHAFVEEVAQRSGGTVTLEPVWRAAGDAFEQGVAHMLVDGQVELAMAAGRGWDDTGVASMQALQAPFLITDDALAIAVATSPVAGDMLAGMASKGITGLALWPEDLRHPFAFEPCMGPILAPGDFTGKTIRSIPSAATWDLLRTLGATPISINSYQDKVASCDIQGAESGLRQGATLPGHPTVTGDITFYPKYQVLAGNSAALGRLSDAQRAAIADAAVAVRDRAVAEHPSEADAAAQWCVDGGSVVLAGPDAVAAFEAAVQPVFDRMAADQVSAAAIQAIRGLAATLKPAAGAQACASAPISSATPRAGRDPDHTAPGWRVAGGTLPRGYSSTRVPTLVMPGPARGRGRSVAARHTTKSTTTTGSSSSATPTSARPATWCSLSTPLGRNVRTRSTPSGGPSTMPASICPWWTSRTPATCRSTTRTSRRSPGPASSTSSACRTDTSVRPTRCRRSGPGLSPGTSSIRPMLGPYQAPAGSPLQRQPSTVLLRSGVLVPTGAPLASGRQAARRNGLPARTELGRCTDRSRWDQCAEAGRQRSLGRESPDDEAVVVVHLGRDVLPAELDGSFASGFAHPGT